MVHFGIGCDVHALVAGRKLILGGGEIPHTIVPSISEKD
jgi:2C-methyl-D-erythritol 2,4-cyclodiphosphate synthase